MQLVKVYKTIRSKGGSKAEARKALDQAIIQACEADDLSLDEEVNMLENIEKQIRSFEFAKRMKELKTI